VVLSVEEGEEQKVVSMESKKMSKEVKSVSTRSPTWYNVTLMEFARAIAYSRSRFTSMFEAQSAVSYTLPPPTECRIGRV
jgi:hypothetical protein